MGWGHCRGGGCQESTRYTPAILARKRCNSPGQVIADWAATSTHLRSSSENTAQVPTGWAFQGCLVCRCAHTYLAQRVGGVRWSCVLSTAAGRRTTASSSWNVPWAEQGRGDDAAMDLHARKGRPCQSRAAAAAKRARGVVMRPRSVQALYRKGAVAFCCCFYWLPT